MKKLYFKTVAAIVVASNTVCILALRAQDAPAVPAAPATAPAAKPAQEPADVAAPKRDKDGNIQPNFLARHEAFLKRGKDGKIGVLFLGDSITAGWGGAKATWEQNFGAYDPANFGIGGDRTQHVLWRIENGELDGITPKTVVLMIGTNNSGSYMVEEIAKGNKKIVEAIRQKLPDTKVMLLAIFPRGADPATPNVAAIREKIKTVNAELAKLDDGNKVRYLDIGQKFLDAEGKLAKEIMPDALHLSGKGYTIWAEAIKPLLDEMMK